MTDLTPEALEELREASLLYPADRQVLADYFLERGRFTEPLHVWYELRAPLHRRIQRAGERLIAWGMAMRAHNIIGQPPVTGAVLGSALGAQSFDHANGAWVAEHFASEIAFQKIPGLPLPSRVQWPEARWDGAPHYNFNYNFNLPRGQYRVLVAPPSPAAGGLHVVDATYNLMNDACVRVAQEHANARRHVKGDPPYGPDVYRPKMVTTSCDVCYGTGRYTDGIAEGARCDACRGTGLQTVPAA